MILLAAGCSLVAGLFLILLAGFAYSLSRFPSGESYPDLEVRWARALALEAAIIGGLLILGPLLAALVVWSWVLLR